MHITSKLAAKLNTDPLDPELLFSAQDPAGSIDPAVKVYPDEHDKQAEASEVAHSSHPVEQDMHVPGPLYPVV